MAPAGSCLLLLLSSPSGGHSPPVEGLAGQGCLCFLPAQLPQSPHLVIPAQVPPPWDEPVVSVSVLQHCHRVTGIFWRRKNHPDRAGLRIFTRCLMFSLVSEVIWLVTEGTSQDAGNTYLRIGWFQSKHGASFQVLVLP